MDEPITQLEQQLEDIRQRLKALGEAEQRAKQPSSIGVTRFQAAPRALSVRALSSLIQTGSDAQPNVSAPKRKLAIVKRGERSFPEQNITSTANDKRSGVETGATSVSSVVDGGNPNTGTELAKDLAAGDEEELRQILLRNRQVRLRSNEDEKTRLMDQLKELGAKLAKLQHESVANAFAQGNYLWTQTNPPLAWRPALESVSVKTSETLSGAESSVQGELGTLDDKHRESQEEVLWIGFSEWQKSEMSEKARNISHPPPVFTVVQKRPLKRIQRMSGSNGQKTEEHVLRE